MTVWNHLKKAGYKKKLDVWVPHELTQRNFIDRITINEMFSSIEIELFFKRIITGDRGSKDSDPPQTISKPGLSVNKVMLKVWLDGKRIVHYEMLQPGETIDSVQYCALLDRLNEAIKKERSKLTTRKGVVFHHDNVWPQTTWLGSVDASTV